MINKKYPSDIIFPEIIFRMNYLTLFVLFSMMPLNLTAQHTRMHTSGEKRVYADDSYQVNTVNTIIRSGESSRKTSRTLSYNLNPVSTMVQNIRSVLGVGRRIWTDHLGRIHVDLLRGSEGTYKLIYARSDNGGAFFIHDGPLGEFYPGDDRYPGLFLNDNGVYISYSENNIPSAGKRAPMILYNPDPFGTGNWSGNDLLRYSGPAGDFLITNCGGDNQKVISVYREGYKNQSLLSCSADSFITGPLIGDTTYIKGSASGLAVDGNYMIAAWGAQICQLMDSNITDCWILESEWMMYSESSDGGISFNDPVPVFGFSLTDFPLQTIDTGAAPINVYIAGPTRWTNEKNPLISNGKVYVITNGETFDTNHFFSGLSAVVVSQKPVGTGGTWIHSVASAPLSWANSRVANGNYWYAELGVVREYPDLMFIAAVDRATNPDDIVIFGSRDGGLNWNVHAPIRITGSQLGFSPITGIRCSASPYATYINENEMNLDLTFVADSQGLVINQTQYHLRVNIAALFPDVDIKDQPKKTKTFELFSNYPNPFNSSTMIRYDLPDYGEVTLKVYNLLGQVIKTLYSGFQSAGQHHVRWDGTNRYGRPASSGIYICRLELKSKLTSANKTIKMILIK